MKVPVRHVVIAAFLFATSATTTDIRAQTASPVAVTPTTPSVETLFADATAKEVAVRRALAARNPATTLLKAVRTVAEDYETLAKRNPTSSQADDALWRAAKLSADAFAAFHDPQERATAVRLFQSLAAQYPASRLAKQTSTQLSALKAAPVRSAPPVPATASVPAPVAPPPSVVAEQPTPPPAPAVAAPPAQTRTPTRAAHVPRPIPQPSTPPPLPAGKVATIKDIRRAAMRDGVRVVIELDREVLFHDEHLENPSRVFVDLPGTQASAPLKDQTIRFDGDGDLVRQVRVGRHPGNTTRVVLDTDGVSSYSIYPLYSPYRLVIDFLKPSTEPVPIAAAALLPRAPATPVQMLLSIRHLSDVWTAGLPLSVPGAGAVLAEARTVDAPARLPASPVVPSASTPPLPTAAPSTNLAGGFSISRQLGLNVSRIVIDPGHGGHDPGAKGGGTSEAELVLDVSLRLAQLLQKVPGLEVVLTRKTDDYVTLQERTAIANREGADLFLSIHANANNSAQAQGIETYFLNFATTLSAAAVAARENAASGQNMGELPDVVKTIALNNKLDESRDFATFVQREMVTKLRPANKAVRDLGVKQAPFVVLIGAAMPSVLAEISFMTNPQEARLLKSTAYRQRIADALFEAVRTYQASLKKVPSLAQQSR
jgi:N-acetylmuramoyl-L-alanine amidase